jgi:hypothetical protein
MRLHLPQSSIRETQILCCLSCSVQVFANQHLYLQNGLGRDIWTLEFHQITNILLVSFHIASRRLHTDGNKLFWVEEFVYPPITLGAKISILLLYLRLFPSTEGWVRTACWTTMIITAITLVPGYLTVIFQCDPISFAWYVLQCRMLKNVNCLVF